VNAESVAVVVLALVTLAAVAIPVAVSSKRRRVVIENSAALAGLLQLNQSYQGRLSYPGPIAFNWEDRVSSKAKLDRYDLRKFFFERLAMLEEEIHLMIAVQVKDVSVYAEYQNARQEVGSAQLGRSTTEKLNPEAFARIERKLFIKRALNQPACVAHVRCTVRYTSPQGKNSYVRWQDWDFEQLRNGLAEMRRIRENQSTATFLRQQERNRMNANIRYQVLARDKSRCRRCGATPETHGVSLHVDHIIPVSKGGKTELGNLQTLCETCNLGKSNRH
jgi:5-methylcytosine-specific restriction endonuclease McrA